MKKTLNGIELLLCICFVGFHLYTGFFGAILGIGQKSIHLFFLLLILFIGLFRRDQGKKLLRAFDVLCFALSAAVTVYITYISRAVAYDDTYHTRAMDIAAVLLIIVLLIATWRKVGWILGVVVIFFVFYAFYGFYFPSIMRHSGMAFTRFTHLICYTAEGIFGSPLTSSASFICIYIILGSLFTVTGVGDYITTLASSLVGTFRGGPAKVATIASGLFGSISGSAVANVIGTGTFTIPMMKKVGYDDEFAGAVEATASTGGQIMPPIMGAAAFLMAEIIGTKYWAVVKAALIPAVLYYLALILQIDLYALRKGLKGVDRSELAPLKDVLKGIWKLSPLVVLVLFIGPFNASITRAGIYTIAFTLVLSFFSKETRLTKQRIIDFFYNSGRGCVSVAVACAIVGVIIGVVTGSGLSFRLSAILVQIANGNLLILMVITMLCSILLGMGLPSTACYLVLATLVAPAMVKLNVPIMAAHMFVFYFGIISNVTPPVAMAAYAAAGLSGGNPSKTGFIAFRLAISGFILPFMFVFNPALLMDGSPIKIVQCLITALIGTYSISASMEGTIWNAKINLAGRVASFAAALLLIDSGTVTDIAGLVIIVLVHVFFNQREKKLHLLLSGQESTLHGQ